MEAVRDRLRTRWVWNLRRVPTKEEVAADVARLKLRERIGKLEEECAQLREQGLTCGDFRGKLLEKLRGELRLAERTARGGK
jgi:hypothetical protein